MVFHELLRRIFDYNVKINKATGFIVSGLFFHMSINIIANFFYYLNITEDIEPYSCL